MSHHNNHGNKHCKKACPKKCETKCEVFDKWSCSESSCDEPKRMKQVTVVTKYKNVQCHDAKKEWGHSTRVCHDWECVEPCEKKFEKKDKCHKKRHH